MVLITEVIPVQNFEFISKKIGEILKVELENQKLLQGFEDPVNVFHERLENFDPSDIMMINVMLDGQNDNANSQKITQGNTSFNVDFYAAGKARQGKHGGADSGARLQRFLGMAKYILTDARYRTLGYEPGFIGGVYVDNIQTATLTENNANFAAFARMSVSVRLSESHQMEQGTALTNAITGIKLEETEKGYKYELTQ